jgi:hypothetical protein
MLSFLFKLDIIVSETRPDAWYLRVAQVFHRGRHHKFVSHHVSVISYFPSFHHWSNASSGARAWRCSIEDFL